MSRCTGFAVSANVQRVYGESGGGERFGENMHLSATDPDSVQECDAAERLGLDGKVRTVCKLRPITCSEVTRWGETGIVGLLDLLGSAGRRRQWFRWPSKCDREPHPNNNDADNGKNDAPKDFHFDHPFSLALCQLQVLSDSIQRKASRKAPVYFAGRISES